MRTSSVGISTWLLLAASDAFSFHTPPAVKRNLQKQAFRLPSGLSASAEPKDLNTKVAVLREDKSSGEASLGVAVTEGDEIVGVSLATLKNDTTQLKDADGLVMALKNFNEKRTVDFDQERSKDVKDDIMQLLVDVEEEAENIAREMLDEECEFDDKGGPTDELCADETARSGFRAYLKGTVGKTLKMVRGLPSDEEDDDTVQAEGFQGDLLEKGWGDRGGVSSIRRNAEVWKFALKCAFRALKPRSLRKKGAPEEEIKQAQNDAATFIRDGLLTLGPTFVKLDVLPATYIDVLKTLQDEVPGFSGARAKEIVSKELGKPVDEIFTDFSKTPLKAASLGQVHTAYYKGQKIAIKVQREGLKNLFDVDLKNLKKLAVLLDKFDPKSDGADRNWVSIYEESERLLYLEIDYINEADNCEKFAKDFRDIKYVRVPRIYRDLTTPRVLTMEFIESLKLTDIKRIDELGLDKKKLAKHTADAFLRQIVETSYFHCDPHPGNLCVDEKGNLVYYDFGMMDVLKPNVREGFRKFCTALFTGGPMIDDTALAKNAKKLVDGVEQAGVLARGADRLAVEKLARYFMRSFKDNQLGKKAPNIKATIGSDLQTLTENNVFRFPSTFTFIFRAFASVEGIGKGLDKDYDIGKLAQPFLDEFIDAQNDYYSVADKQLRMLTKATGLNTADIETAIKSPKKIAYIEETLRAMENGSLKIRVRSLENEKALERMVLTNQRQENILLASVFLNVAGLASRRILSGVGLAGAAFFAIQTLVVNMKVKKFDKTQVKFQQVRFDDDE